MKITSPSAFIPRRGFGPALFYSLAACVLPAVMLTAATAHAQTNRPVITSATNAIGTVGVPFSYTITATGNPTNFGAFSLPSGIFPPVPGSANVTGLPQAAGTFAANISAANSNGSTLTNLALTINPPAAPALASPVSVFGVQGQPLNYPLLSTPNHSNVPTTFSVSGLPSGAVLSSNVTLNAAYPNIAVTNYFITSPSLQANGSFVVPVVLSNQGGVRTNNVTFIVNPPNAPQFTIPTNPVAATVGLPFSFDATAINSPALFRVTNIALLSYWTNNTASPTNYVFTNAAGIVTTNVAVPANGVVTNVFTNTTGLSIQNGLLTNGLSFSNVTVGNSLVGRISGTPGLTSAIQLGLQAVNNFGSVGASLIINVGNPDPTVIISQPLAEALFVTGSSFYLNAQIFDEPDDILVPSTFEFQDNAVPLAGSVGIYGDYFGLEYYPGAQAPSITASGQNGQGVATVSPPFRMASVEPRNPLPAIEMLPINIGQQLVAGGKITLSALATIPSSTTTINRVEFYVNKVYVGSSLAPEPNTQGVYEFEWTSPPIPGAFQVTARAISLNHTRGIEQTPYWASVIARRPVIVSTQEGAAPSVLITSPAPNAILAIGVPNRIQATASLTGGAIESVEFFANGKRITSGVDKPNPDTQVPFEVDFTPNSFGSYEIYAIATGSNGLQTVSPVILANVPTGFAPTVAITAPGNGVTVPLGPLAIRWVASDRDGSIQKAELFVNGTTAIGPDGEPLVIDRNEDPSANPGSAIVRYLPPSEGTFRFTVRVTDNSANVTESQPVIVTVDNSNPNLPPIVAMTHPVPAGLTADGQTDDVNDFSLPSQLYFNAEVIVPVGVTVDPANVFFFNRGQKLSGTVTRFGNTFAFRWQPPAKGEYNISAQVTDSRGLTSESESLRFDIGELARPLAKIELLEPTSPQVAVGSNLILQARSNQGTQKVNRIDFYANGVLIGTAEPRDVNNTWITTNFEWTPPSTGVFTLSARAVQTVPGGAANGSDNSVISDSRPLEVVSATGLSPLVSLLQQPISESIYVVGSQLFLNATAVARGSATIPDNGVNFYYAGSRRPATSSGVSIGTSRIYSAKVDVEDGAESIAIFATAQDSLRSIGTSSATTLQAVRPLRELPSVKMLPLTSLGPFSAGTPVKLRAQATFPSTANTDARVEFYANGAYLGAATQVANQPTVYEFSWVTPEVTGDFVIEARALAVNFETDTGNDNVIRHWGSVISPNSQAVKVEALPGGLIPGSDEEFVVQIYEKLLYRPPTFREWTSGVAALRTGATDRAGLTATLMGYSEDTKLFNRDFEYAKSSAIAFSVYARLGMTPTNDDILNFLLMLESDPRSLPWPATAPTTGSSAVIPDAPWGATYGMAAAMQTVFESGQFLLKYPEVTGLPDNSFVQWLGDVMFTGRSVGGGESTLIALMSSLEDPAIRFGAAAAVWNQFCTYALAATEGGYVYDSAGTPLERIFQLQLGTAALRFQLGLGWDWTFAQANRFSLTVVDQALIQAGLSTGAPPPRASAVRYQGLVGGKVDLERVFKAVDGAEATAVSSDPKPEAISGDLRIRQSRKGRYTAVLRLSDGSVYRGKGSALPSGAIKATWNPSQGATSAGVAAVDLSRTAPKGFAGLFGNITRAGETLAAVLAEDARIKLPAPAGPYRFDLGGGGSVELKLSKRSRARLWGQLPDGASFTTSAPLWKSATVGERVLVYRPLRQRSPLRGWFDNSAASKTWQATLSWQ